MFQLDLAAQVDRGLVRKTNQDVARVVPRLALALVADGMGGHDHGDIASRMAAAAFEQCFDRLGGAGLTIDETRQRVLRSFREANARVGAHPAARADGTGMGTTLVAAAFAHGQTVVAHVGDSRCYRLRDGWLELLTEDHSYAAALRRSGTVHTPAADRAAARWENVLTRAINGREPLEVDLEVARCKPGDVYLLCSDGLWGAVRAELAALILSTATDASDACKKLIGAAWADGGLDNIGVAVVRLMPPVLRLDDPSKFGDQRDEVSSVVEAFVPSLASRHTCQAGGQAGAASGAKSDTPGTVQAPPQPAMSGGAAASTNPSRSPSAQPTGSAAATEEACCSAVGSGASS